MTQPQPSCTVLKRHIDKQGHRQYRMRCCDPDSVIGSTLILLFDDKLKVVAWQTSSRSTGWLWFNSARMSQFMKKLL
jgi:hypothetical protein